MQLNVDGQIYEIDVEEEMPLLWVLRDELGIKGVRYGCGVAQCGACSVLMDGKAVRSCQIPAQEATGHIITIEGASASKIVPTLQQAWTKHQVAQCGYCQSGQMMQAAALLSEISSPTDADIDDYMSGNLCRCGTYPLIRAAIKDAAHQLKEI